ncbi:MAG: TrkH family potassium uptake protein [Nitrospinales bacterium]
MNLKAVFNVVGILLTLLAGILIAPLGVSLYFQQPSLGGYFSEVQAFSLTLFLALGAGLGLWRLFPSGTNALRDREGFAIVSFSWIVIAFFGALPYSLTGACPSFLDAYFESMSGFTTTGSTILRDIEALPRGLLFWRSMTQWLGGMGIIMLSLALFPVLSMTSIHLFKAEIPGGATVDKFQPRLAETAKILWRVYVALTCVEVILLRFGGISLYDSICAAFSTMSTGGYSPRQESVAAFDSLYSECVVMAFMFLAGMSFVLHYQAVHGHFREVRKNTELRFYISTILLATAFVTVGLWQTSPDPNLGSTLRRAAFQVVSISSTTGFVTDDFNVWPDFLRFFLLILMFAGGCSGSTSGALKMIRIVILFKFIFRELQKLVEPYGVFHVKLGQKTIEPEQVWNVLGLTGLFLGVLCVSSLLLSLMGLDMITAISACAATLFNVGPGLGQVGALGDYAGIPAPGKILIIFCMLMGRLEMYTIMLLFLPLTWRK